MSYPLGLIQQKPNRFSPTTPQLAVTIAGAALTAQTAQWYRIKNDLTSKGLFTCFEVSTNHLRAIEHIVSWVSGRLGRIARES